MFTGWRGARGGLAMRTSGESSRDGASRDRPGRLIPILLAVYLTPALLVVLLVGGVGMLVLAAARTIAVVVHGPEAWPRRSVGPGSSAH